MRRWSWVAVVGVCVLALTVVGTLVIQRVLHGCPASAGIRHDIVVMPGHWWRMSLEEKQIEVLRTLWHTDISRKDLVDALWPSVMEELPAAAGALWESQTIKWPIEPFDEWKDIQAWVMSTLASVQGSPSVFDVYLGCEEWETDDMFAVDEDIADGLTQESRYRISMYTDEILGCAG